ncbi:sensor histidine kinase [Geodermatophilus sp. SYSU D00700]
MCAISSGRRWLSVGRCTVVAAALTVLVTAGHEARHTVLVLLATLGLVAAGAMFLLCWRVTGTRATWYTGVGLVLLGLHDPATVAASALLDQRSPDLAEGVGLAVVVAAACAVLRAATDAGTRPRRDTAIGAGLVALPLVAAVLVAAGTLGPSIPFGGAARASGFVLAGALWVLVAGATPRGDRLDAHDRRSSGALGASALVVGLLTAAPGLPAVVPGTAAAVQAVEDTGLLAVALAAVLVGLHRLTGALAGQERYVAGLLEQLAGHERELQQARACLHDARAAVAGVRAASSAVRHLGPASAARADLEESITLELARLGRMLRLPDRTPSVTVVDLDRVVRPLVVSHRERGLRVAWSPSGTAPVAVDGDALAVILGNLLGNVLSHTPRSLCRVSVEVTDRLMVTVADDGPGLPAGPRDTVFEAGARRPDSPGEGLGLAISRDLARRHGGDLTTADSPVGCCFVLTLPVRAPAQAARSAAVPRPRSAVDVPTELGLAR